MTATGPERPDEPSDDPSNTLIDDPSQEPSDDVPTQQEQPPSFGYGSSAAGTARTDVEESDSSA
jgi:hypothetical protein